jgi:hypothetical protein
MGHNNSQFTIHNSQLLKPVYYLTRYGFAIEAVVMEASPVVIKVVLSQLSKQTGIYFQYSRRMGRQVFSQLGEVIGLVLAWSIIKAAGQKGEFFAAGRGDGQVFGVAAHHAQGIDQTA